MAGNTIDMSMLKQIFRLHLQGVALLKISQIVGASRNTVKKYLRQIEASRLDVESLLAMDEETLAAAFRKENEREVCRTGDLEALFPFFEQELSRTGVNRMVLWGEYRRAHPDGYNYSSFCDHFRQWRQSRQGTMHFDHKPGMELYIDFSGKPLYVTDPGTGEVRAVEVFVATLGYSHYTYVEALETQRKEYFLEAVSNCLEFIGGVPGALIPDNLKSAVTLADKYEALVNRDFLDLANHYGTTVMPTRSRKPRDKAIVEKAVSIVYSRIFAPLRNEVFFSIASLNEAIRVQLSAYNEKAFQIRPGCRLSDFESQDKPMLKPMPLERFEIRNHREVKVHKSGYILLQEDKHYYSVPYRYIGRKVRLVYTTRRISVYCNHECIAIHSRSLRWYGYTTIKEHLSSTHRFVSEWNAERFITWGQKIAPEVGEYIRNILQAATYPEQAYKSCVGILSMERKVGCDRLAAAVRRATFYGTYNYNTIRNILSSGLDAEPPESDNAGGSDIPLHENIRGAQAYQ